MDRVNEIIGHLTDEEYDAVLYGVMLRFLRNKATKLNIDTDYELILLGIDVQSKTIDVYKQDNNYDAPPLLIEEVKVN